MIIADHNFWLYILDKNRLIPNSLNPDPPGVIGSELIAIDEYTKIVDMNRLLSTPNSWRTTKNIAPARITFMADRIHNAVKFLIEELPRKLPAAFPYDSVASFILISTALVILFPAILFRILITISGNFTLPFLDKIVTVKKNANDGIVVTNTKIAIWLAPKYIA